MKWKLELHTDTKNSIPCLWKGRKIVNSIRLLVDRYAWILENIIDDRILDTFLILVFGKHHKDWTSRVPQQHFICMKEKNRILHWVTMTMELSCLWFTSAFVRLLNSAFYMRDKGVEINSSASDVFINFLLNISTNKINFGITIPCDIL